MRKLCFILCCLMATTWLQAQVSDEVEGTGVYDLLDELSSGHVISLNPAVRPYSRTYIARQLQAAEQADSLLSKRLKQEVQFYLQEYALELDTLPDNYVQYTHASDMTLSLAQPELTYSNAQQSKPARQRYTLLVRPVLGAQMQYHPGGVSAEHRYGAEVQMDIARHLSIWGKAYYSTQTCDWSRSEGGVALYDWFGSISAEKSTQLWGNSQAGSLILSGNAPSFPMIRLKITPVRWFEFHYFHAWLTPDAMDTAIVQHEDLVYMRQHKYMAANMLTFMPIPHLELSIGNSVVYAEDRPQAAYFIPIAFYKSLDHLLTKGAEHTQNQNSQAFLTVSTRNLPHLYVYGTFYLDEFNSVRLKKDFRGDNPWAYQVGLSVRNWPIDGLRLKGEFMRSYIACYNNQVNALWYTSGEQYLGHPLGDNAQRIYAELGYRPIRGLDICFTFCQDTRYNRYHPYYNDKSIEEPSFKDKVWQSENYQLRVQYEFFPNCFASLGVRYSDTRGYAPDISEKIAAEDLGQTVLGGEVLPERELPQYYLDQFTPAWLQGKQWVLTGSLYYNF